MHLSSLNPNNCLFGIDKKAIEHTFSLLKYQKEEIKYLRFFYPGNDPRKKKDKGRKLSVAKINLRSLNSYQTEGRGVYFVVNGGGHLDRDIEYGRAIFTEHDNLEIAIQINLWRKLKLPEPTFQVSTGGKSIHSYWVLSSSIDIVLWRTLQRDLLNFTDGDRIIKNPSRVMRLPGCFHISYNYGNPIYSQTKIISTSEQYYSYKDLRASIPLTVKKSTPSLKTKAKIVISPSNKPKSMVSPPAKLIRTLSDIQLPLTIPVPLVICLCRQSRLDLDGVPEGSRNSSGVRLVMDLIGTYNYLSSIGQIVEGEPREYFELFAARCNPPMEHTEIESIWQWAMGEHPQPSSRTEGVDNCLRGYYWRETHPAS
jgi:hypothetical protein